MVFSSLLNDFVEQISISGPEAGSRRCEYQQHGGAPLAISRVLLFEVS
jgi:hypothetical protein